MFGLKMRNWVWLKMLNASPRSSSALPSVTLKVLKRDMSKLMLVQCRKLEASLVGVLVSPPRYKIVDLLQVVEACEVQKHAGIREGRGGKLGGPSSG